jgi:hypothetical protein
MRKPKIIKNIEECKAEKAQEDGGGEEEVSNK